MKELTIEQKAKAYDEAKARMSKAYNSNRCTIGFMNEIFPEFKDEDEKIREEIINYFECQSRDEPCRKSIHDKWIAWIEKQGQTFTKEEVGNANKVEPKFEVGKWIVWQDKCYKVKDNSCGYELLDQDNFITQLEYGTVEVNAHLWTIADAKDGDVLCSESGWICVFKALDILTNTFSSYCFIDKDKWFCNTGSECHTLDKAFIKAYNGEIYPATKEQRDTIMKQWMPQDVLLILKSKYKM